MSLQDSLLTISDFLKLVGEEEYPRKKHGVVIPAWIALLDEAHVDAGEDGEGGQSPQDPGDAEVCFLCCV